MSKYRSGDSCFAFIDSMYPKEIRVQHVTVRTCKPDEKGSFYYYVTDYLGTMVIHERYLHDTIDQAWECYV